MRDIPRQYWPQETPTGAAIVRATLVQFEKPFHIPMSLGISPAQIEQHDRDIAAGRPSSVKPEWFLSSTPWEGFTRDWEAKPAIAEFELEDGWVFEAAFIGDQWRWDHNSQPRNASRTVTGKGGDNAD